MAYGADITLLVNCSGEEHRVLLHSDGTWTVENHNVEQENKLSRLGGELPPCLKVIHKYLRSFGWPRTKLDIIRKDCVEIRHGKDPI